MMSPDEARRQAAVMLEHAELYKARVAPRLRENGWTRRGALWLIYLRYAYLAGAYESEGT